MEPLSSGGEAVPIELAGETVYLVLYGTGLGEAALEEVRAWVHDEEAALTYAGPQGRYPGLDQYNIELSPALAGRGEVPVSIAVRGVPCNPVRIVIL
jgi:uncharacterized protein (TIGR03437 family)